MRKTELISAVTEALKEPGRLEELLYVIDDSSWTLFRCCPHLCFIESYGMLSMVLPINVKRLVAF